ncbi:MAG: hypothetical protein V7767_08355, partial [Leeuwenhoekiella sp.]
SHEKQSSANNLDTLDLTARSIDIQIKNNGTYEVDGYPATKQTLAETVSKLHQDLTPALRNRIMNIHVTKPKIVPYEEAQFIFDQLYDYGFYRLVTGNQEIVKGKGNTPIKTRSKEVEKDVRDIKNQEKNILKITLTNDEINVNGKQTSIENFTKTIDAITADWSKSDMMNYSLQLSSQNGVDKFVARLTEEFRKTKLYKTNPSRELIPPPPPPAPAAPSTINDFPEPQVPPAPPTIGHEPHPVPQVAPVPPVLKLLPEPPAPPAPPSPEEMIKEMTKAGADFYYNGDKITAKKAEQLFEEKENLNFMANKSVNGGKPIVLITDN